MSTGNSTAQSKRIVLESLDEKSKITRNMWFILGGGAFGALLGRELVGGLAAVGLAALITMYLSYDVVKSAPPYCDIVDWTRANWKYLRRPSKFTSAAHAHVATSSKVRAAIETSDTTRDLTEIERFYPPHGVFRRQDGSYAMMLKYSPPNLDFSSGEKYLELMSQIGDAYNKNIDFDLSLHMTSRPVEVEDYFDRLDSRLDDEDVDTNDIFKAILTEMRGHREEMLSSRNTETMHFYFMVTVDENEVKYKLSGDDSATERSRLFGLFSWARSQNVDEDIEARKQRKLKKKLDDKAETLSRAFNSEATGQSSVERVSVMEAAAVFENFWTGNDVPHNPDQIDEDEPVPMSSIMRGPDDDDFEAPDTIEEAVQ
jgi:hypothetical protein